MYDISDTDPADILGDDVVDVYDDDQESHEQQHFNAEELVKMVDPEEVEEFRMRRMMEEMVHQQEQLLQGHRPGMNCIKIGLPGKCILSKKKRSSGSPFL